MSNSVRASRSRKLDLSEIAGTASASSNVLSAFYDRLQETRAYHKKYPNLTTEADDKIGASEANLHSPQLFVFIVCVRVLVCVSCCRCRCRCCFRFSFLHFLVFSQSRALVLFLFELIRRLLTVLLLSLRRRTHGVVYRRRKLWKICGHARST